MFKTIGLFQQNQDKQIYIATTLFYALSFAFASYFFKERCLYLDSAFYLFKIISNEGFNFEASRYGIFLTQIIPIIAIKLGISLKSLMILVSVNFIFVNYLIFIISYHIIGEKKVAVIFPFVFITGISFGFFYSYTEIYQASALVIAFYAWINRRFNKTDIKLYEYIVALLIIIESFLCHPSSIIPIIFICGLHIIHYNQFNIKGVGLFIPFSILLAIIKILLTKSNSYEGNLFSNFINSPELLTNIFSYYPAQYFFDKMFGGIYFIPALSILLLIVLCIKRKKFLLLSYCLSSFFIFWILTVLTFNRGGGSVEIEKMFSPLMLLIIIPLCNELDFKNMNYNHIKVFVFYIIILSGFYQIHKIGKKFTGRTDKLIEMMATLSKTGENKFIVNYNDLMQNVRSSWSVAVESLFLSAIMNPEKQLTIFIAKNKQQLSGINLNNPKLFLAVPFWIRWETPLNKRYFRLKESKYKWINEFGEKSEEKPHSD